MYLVDTNIWLERILDQTKSGEVGDFLEHTTTGQLFVTDFSFHSIGVIMSKLQRTDGLLRFVQDVFIDGAITLIHVEPDDTERIVQVIKRFNLDFDDGYQYVAAEKHNLTIVSFDSDFDHTERGRKIPSEILAG